MRLSELILRLHELRTKLGDAAVFATDYLPDQKSYSAGNEVVDLRVLDAPLYHDRVVLLIADHPLHKAKEVFP